MKYLLALFVASFFGWFMVVNFFKGLESFMNDNDSNFKVLFWIMMCALSFLGAMFGIGMMEIL